MKKITTKAGYIAYEASSEEIKQLGGFGICDSCMQEVETGYLLPVMNRWHCTSCHKKWEEKARYYPEDIPIENENIVYYESRLPLEN